MAFEIIDASPQHADFTPISEHAVQTPGSFFGGKPVLHLHAPAAALKIPSHDFAAQDAIRKLAGSDATSSTESASDAFVTIAAVDVWVTSRSLILFAQPSATGLAIPYATISVTAQDGADVLLELNLSDPNTTPDDEIEFMQLRIAAHAVQPPPSTAAALGAEHRSGAAPAANGVNGSGPAAAAALFRAISDCQELNPDPVLRSGVDGTDDDDDDYDTPAFDETAPGATGWITSENMADFMDEHGNFRLPSGGGGGDYGDEHEHEHALGAGAGRARSAAEVDADDGADEGADAKWQRTG